MTTAAAESTTTAILRDALMGALRATFSRMAGGLKIYKTAFDFDRACNTLTVCGWVENIIKENGLNHVAFPGRHAMYERGGYLVHVDQTENGCDISGGSDCETF